MKPHVCVLVKSNGGFQIIHPQTFTSVGEIIANIRKKQQICVLSKRKFAFSNFTIFGVLLCFEFA